MLSPKLRKPLDFENLLLKHVKALMIQNICCIVPLSTLVQIRTSSPSPFNSESQMILDFTWCPTQSSLAAYITQASLIIMLKITFLESGQLVRLHLIFET